MTEDAILEIGIDEAKRLFVRPAKTTFEFIYRAAMGVHWDEHDRRLLSGAPGDWTYRRWFEQILAVARDEYGVCLKLSPTTRWTNVADDIRSDIRQAAAP